MRGLVLLTLLPVLFGCGEPEHPTQVIVVFDASEGLRERVRSIVVRVLDGDGVEVGETEIAIDDPTVDLPYFGLRLVPRDGDASRRFSLLAEALDATGSPIGSQSVAGGYVADEVREAWVVFDPECEARACPEGFRCQLGRCVERCVEATPAGGVTRSRPAACDSPCAAPACLGEVIASCEDGALAVERACELGCASPSACQEVVASNVLRVIGPPSPELGELRVTTGDFAYTRDSGRGWIDAIRPESGSGDVANGIRWEEVTIDGRAYQVFEVNDLVIEEDSTLRLVGVLPHIFLVHGEAIIDGKISGRGGRIVGAVADGGGMGGGGAGQLGAGSGGGGGGAYGSPGGSGGASGAAGGAGGAVYGGPELTPLLVGSAGGGGAGGASGGGGAGAIQISARLRIVVGPTGVVQSNGARGETLAGAGGGGGGSGGSILLESPAVTLEDGPNVRVSAVGGGGGDGASAMGEPIDGAAGATSSDAGDDGADAPMAAGGGGGAGRVRINNADGSGADSYARQVLPTGAQTFTVGLVGRGAPR